MLPLMNGFIWRQHVVPYGVIVVSLVDGLFRINNAAPEAIPPPCVIPIDANKLKRAMDIINDMQSHPLSNQVVILKHLQ